MSNTIFLLCSNDLLGGTRTKPEHEQNAVSETQLVDGQSNMAGGRMLKGVKVIKLSLLLFFKAEQQGTACTVSYCTER